MADQFTLSGSYGTIPLGGSASLDPSLDSAINEPLVLKYKTVEQIALAADPAVSVPFGAVTSAHVVILKAQGGKVKARITSADGTQQSVPFDTFLILMSQSVPVTAIDLTRVPATDTTVRVFLGEKA